MSSWLETKWALFSYSCARTVSQAGRSLGATAEKAVPSLSPQQSAPVLRMSARAEYFRQLARKCAAAADAAADPVTKAKFEQEQHQWLLRAEQAEKTERNLLTRLSREGRLRKPARRSRR